MDKNDDVTKCSGCSCCAMRADVGEPKISGFKLVVCAFLVFVLPLLNSAIAAQISYQYYQCSVWMTVVIALATAGITILLVKLLTFRIHSDSESGSNSCRKEA
ncbi:MAG: hypothetical protein GX629_04110 [Phycisphaerae bacterium]|nr:hypothetical protein [Phycisphaerae bacterium]